MKIGVLTISSPDGGGVYQYTLSLLEALKLIRSKFDFVQIRYPDFPKILDKDIIINKQKSSIALKIKRIVHAYTNIVIGNLIPNIHDKLASIDLIISPAISLLPFHMKKMYIVTIHDFQQEYYPNFFTLKERISRKIVYRTGQKASLVICESDFVKRDIMKFLNVSEQKIKVISSPPPSYLQKIEIIIDKLKEIKDKYNLPERYIFYPAQFWFHKNHIKLLEALSLLRNKYNTIVPLILVGSKKNNFNNVMKAINKLNLERQVKYLGYVPDEEMPYLYKLSTALVMPTLFESVSMPIWEAFYLGCTVVSSNVCALPEQVGDAGLLFDPNNVENMAERIYKIWTDKNLRQELIQKGYERVKDFTIENYAKKWEKIIEEVVLKI